MTSLKFTQGTGWPSGWLDTTKMSDGFILDLIILLIVGGLCSVDGQGHTVYICTAGYRDTGEDPLSPSRRGSEGL